MNVPLITVLRYAVDYDISSFYHYLKKFLGFYLFLFPHKNCLTREIKYYFIFKTSGFIAFKSEGILYNTFTLCIFLGFICDITYDEGIKFYIVH